MTDAPTNRTLTDDEMRRIEELHCDIVAFIRDRGRQLGIETSYVAVSTCSNLGVDFTDDANLDDDEDIVQARLECVISHALAVGEALEVDLKPYVSFVAEQILEAHNTLKDTERYSFMPSVLSESSN